MRRNEDRLPVQRGQNQGLSRTGDADFFTPSSFLSLSPWQTMRRMHEDMDRLLGQFFTETPSGGTRGGMQQWMPSVDISQNNKEWCIEADLPGVNKDDIEVEVRDHHLVLKAELRSEQQDEGGEGREYHQRERQFGFFERVLPLPENVDEEHIACDFKNGVLTLHVPKLEQALPAARRIPITSGETSTQGTTAQKKEAAPKEEKGGGQQKMAA